MPKTKTTKKKNTNHIQKMTTKHEEIMRRKLSGETNKEIAKAVKLTEERISFICNSPIFVDLINKKRKSINERFEEELALDNVKSKFHKAAPKAADILIKNLDHPNAKINMSAANDVLGYDGHQKKPSEDHSTKILIQGDVYQGFNIAMKALKIDEKLLIDAGLGEVVRQIDTTENDRDKSKGISGVREEEFLDILSGDNAE